MARILIVEDETLIAMSLEFTLAEAGHTVQVAANGRQALEILPLFAPDVVITDYMMPLMDGADLIARLRRDHSTRGVIIVLTTSLPSASLEGRVDDFDAYLQKPVSQREMVATVERLLASR